MSTTTASPTTRQSSSRAAAGPARLSILQRRTVPGLATTSMGMQFAQLITLPEYKKKQNKPFPLGTDKFKPLAAGDKGVIRFAVKNKDPYEGSITAPIVADGNGQLVERLYPVVFGLFAFIALHYCGNVDEDPLTVACSIYTGMRNACSLLAVTAADAAAAAAAAAAVIIGTTTAFIVAATAVTTVTVTVAADTATLKGSTSYRSVLLISTLHCLMARLSNVHLQPHHHKQAMIFTLLFMSIPVTIGCLAFLMWHQIDFSTDKACYLGIGMRQICWDGEHRCSEHLDWLTLFLICVNVPVWLINAQN
eukprot:COSAG05_NODE_84_length_20716_cov_100.586312_8_plen_307_part_00